MYQKEKMDDMSEVLEIEIKFKMYLNFFINKWKNRETYTAR
jgi:hypothetical protein